MIGPAAYQKLVHREIDRVLRLKTCGKRAPWPDRGDGLEGGPYQARWGDDWKMEMYNKLLRDGYMCVTDLMDHVIREGNKLFEDTPHANTWYFF